MNKELESEFDLGDMESHSCEFAEWLHYNRWFNFSDGKWSYTFSHPTSISEKSYDKNYRKTTKELYDIFCMEQGY